ncbi:MAG: methyltransferase, TrmH family [Chloroflexota bacterium]|jgi:TrmH family RNA methyltransferase|nr:methyltransferase, TrmH family [Chloroflexota bacterium]
MSEPRTIVASPTNPRVRAAAALRDRRERDRTGRLLIDGARELLRALDAGLTVETVFVCPSLCRSSACAELLRRIDPGDARIVEVGEKAFARIAFGDRAEGVIGVAVRPGLDLAGVELPSDPLVVVVEGVEKPGNLGAIARTADGVGADALIAVDPRTDLFNPNAIRASLGTIFSLPVASSSADETLAWLRASGVGIVVARVDGDATYTDADLRGPLAIVLGSEAEGLSDAWAGPDVVAVRLPMLGAADSLNVSVAAGILLYEARRQRGRPSRS